MNTLTTKQLLLLLAGANEAQNAGIIHGTWFHEMIIEMAGKGQLTENTKPFYGGVLC